MVDLALVLIGVWLIFSFVHAELRRREAELGRAKKRERADRAEDRARAVEAELEGMAAPAPVSPPIVASLPAEPMGAPVAEGVSPPPAEPDPRSSPAPREVVRERPEIPADATLRARTEDREHELA